MNRVEIKQIKKVFVDDDEKLSRLFNVMGDLCRLRILKLLLKEEGLCVSDIADICGITVSASSQQLRTLELGGIIKKRRRGQKMCFEIKQNDNNVRSILEMIK